MSFPPTSSQTAVHGELSTFLSGYEDSLRSVFRDRAEAINLHSTRGLPPSIMREILARLPLAVFIPEAYGGRGERVDEILAVLDATSYESLAMSLTLGINGALFLQPLSKYGREEIKGPIFERFLNHQNMGGLMMTEPGFGSDALNMETSYALADGRYHIEGMKHWAGLTGLADYWLVMARPRNEEGQLGRDVGFFVCDTHDPEQAVQVAERFESLGLFAIPYGRNRIDVRIPEEQRLVSKGTGLQTMLDLLHRSRMQFPGMGLGFLRRMFDEALDHCRQRRVGGKSLIDYDQVVRRLARLQASVTAATAMCAYAAENAGLGTNLARHGIHANAIKAVLTDLMQEASQSLLQLTGAKGYRWDHIAGRSTVDSRPFQIFEGSNDILYEQLAQATLKLMQREQEPNLYQFLRNWKKTARASDVLRRVTDFTVDSNITQRRLVDLGNVFGRILTMEFVIELGERGFHRELIDNCVEQLRQEVSALLSFFRDEAKTGVVEDYESKTAAWLGYSGASTAR